MSFNPARRRVLFTLLATLALAVTGSLGSRDLQARFTRQIVDLQPTVLLVSLDGFRHDYLARFHPANLEALAATGVRARSMTPVFPTLTFPNHYSIITGLYPEHHGIVSNTMVDPEIPGGFSLGGANAGDPRWWSDGEPLWVTAVNQGQRAATMFWPGSDVAIRGVRPTYFRPYSGAVLRQARVQQVLSWLDLPQAERPTFLTLYLEEVDHAGHERGPDSPEVARSVAEVDESVGELIAGLNARGIADRVQLIIVSDHGMASISRDRAIALDRYVDLTHVEIVGSGAMAGINPKPGFETEVYAALTAASASGVPMRVYRSRENPERLHYRAHRRIPAITLIADEHATIGSTARAPGAGTHGYDNAVADMQALFIAHGPAFKRGVVVEPFENIHLYSLMAHLLSLTPARTDGDLESVRSVLAP